jgi:phosphoribosyl-ATP pyrophosphohydrolase
MELDQAANAVVDTPATEAPATPEPEPTTTPEPTEPAQEPVTEPTEKPLTETQNVARRIKEATEKAAEKAKQEAREAFLAEKAAEADALIAEIYQGQFKTVAEYRAAVERQKLIDEGKDPEVYAEIQESKRQAEEARKLAEMTQSELKAYRQKEAILAAADAYAQHPKWGQFFTANRDAVMAEAMKLVGNDGSAESMLDYARMLVLNDTYKPVDVDAIKAEAVKEYLAGLKKQAAPVEARGGGIPNTPPTTSGNPLKDAFAASMNRLKGELK